MAFVHKQYEIQPDDLIEIIGPGQSRIAPDPNSGVDARLNRTNYARVQLQAEQSGLWIGSTSGVTIDNGFELPAGKPYLVVMPPSDQLWVIAEPTGPTRTLQAMATF